MEKDSSSKIFRSISDGELVPKKDYDSVAKKFEAVKMGPKKPLETEEDFVKMQEERQEEKDKLLNLEKQNNKEIEITKFIDSIRMLSLTKQNDLVIQSVSEYLIKENNLFSIKGKKETITYLYSDGVYIEGQANLECQIEGLLTEYSKNHTVNEILKKIGRLTTIKREEIKLPDVKFVCLKNGILDVSTMILQPHTPDYIFYSKIPINYNPEAKCPNILKFLNEVLYEEDIPLMQEWIGYIFNKNYYIKKASIFVGEKDTAKTTLLNLIVALIGQPNISGVSLQSLVSDRFSAANLHNKHLNIFDDMSSNDVEDTGAFKIATGGGWINGEFKFGDQFQFMNFAKLTFACNKIPPAKDSDDDAYFGRWLIFRFDNVFDDSNTDTNKHLIDEITSESELEGFLNFGLAGLQRLLENNKFSCKKTTEEIKSIMQRSGSPLVAFVQDCVYQTDVWLSKEDLYKSYRNYVILHNMPVMTKEKFGRNITKKCSFIEDSRKGQTTGWRGVNVRNPDGSWKQTLSPEVVEKIPQKFDILREIPQEIATNFGVPNTVSGCTIDLNDLTLINDLKQRGFVREHLSY